MQPAMTRPRRRLRPANRDPWAAFAAGLLGGVLGGLLLLTFGGILLLPLAIVALVGGMLVRPRPFGTAGTLGGWGAAWAITLLAAGARCDPPACVSPDLTGWLIVAGVLIAGCGAILAVAIRRQGRRRNSGRPGLS